MEITPVQSKKADAFVKFVFEEDRPDGLQKYMLKKSAVTWFYSEEGKSHTLAVGLGKKEKFNLEVLRHAAGSSGRAMLKEKVQSVAVDFGPIRDFHDSDCSLLIAWIEGFLLGSYSFDKFKSEKTPITVESMQILSLCEEGFQKAVQSAKIRAEAVAFARDLVNEPANHLYPESFISRIQSHFSKRPVTIRVYQGEELIRERMEGLICVGRGSKNPPAMAEIRYVTDSSLPLLALIGKGITFDMGGMNVKSGSDISNMRCDMGGAAAVAGAMDIITQMKPHANVAALLPLAENLPDGGAYLPSHLIEYPNGISVQVANTDAEGRLVLADALLLAKRLGAAEAIDIATLTGNIVAALGEETAGVFGDDELVRHLTDLSHCGDPLWPMPLIDEYEESLKSNYADISNISSSPYAGSVTAALFLRRFSEGMRWAHIDMAGTMDVKTAKGYRSPGATGFGARILADYVMDKCL